jgi:hypothetical protein
VKRQRRAVFAAIVRVLVDVIDTIGSKGTGPAHETMDFVPFGKKKLGQVRSILTSNTSD